MAGTSEKSSSLPQAFFRAPAAQPSATMLTSHSVHASAPDDSPLGRALIGTRLVLSSRVSEENSRFLSNEAGLACSYTSQQQNHTIAESNKGSENSSSHPSLRYASFPDSAFLAQRVFEASLRSSEHSSVSTQLSQFSELSSGTRLSASSHAGARMVTTLATRSRAGLASSSSSTVVTMDEKCSNTVDVNNGVAESTNVAVPVSIPLSYVDVSSSAAGFRTETVGTSTITCPDNVYQSYDAPRAVTLDSATFYKVSLVRDEAGNTYHVLSPVAQSASQPSTPDPSSVCPGQERNVQNVGHFSTAQDHTGSQVDPCISLVRNAGSHVLAADIHTNINTTTDLMALRTLNKSGGHNVNIATHNSANSSGRNSNILLCDSLQRRADKHFVLGRDVPGMPSSHTSLSYKRSSSDTRNGNDDNDDDGEKTDDADEDEDMVIDEDISNNNATDISIRNLGSQKCLRTNANSKSTFCSNPENHNRHKSPRLESRDLNSQATPIDSHVEAQTEIGGQSRPTCITVQAALDVSSGQVCLVSLPTQPGLVVHQSQLDQRQALFQEGMLQNSSQQQQYKRQQQQQQLENILQPALAQNPPQCSLMANIQQPTQNSTISTINKNNVLYISAGSLPNFSTDINNSNNSNSGMCSLDDVTYTVTKVYDHPDGVVNLPETTTFLPGLSNTGILQCITRDPDNSNHTSSANLRDTVFTVTNAADNILPSTSQASTLPRQSEGHAKQTGCNEIYTDTFKGCIDTTMEVDTTPPRAVQVGTQHIRNHSNSLKTTVSPNTAYNTTCPETARQECSSKHSYHRSFSLSASSAACSTSPIPSMSRTTPSSPRDFTQISCTTPQRESPRTIVSTIPQKPQPKSHLLPFLHHPTPLSITTKQTAISVNTSKIELESDNPGSVERNHSHHHLSANFNQLTQGNGARKQACSQASREQTQKQAKLALPLTSQIPKANTKVVYTSSPFTPSPSPLASQETQPHPSLTFPLDRSQQPMSKSKHVSDRHVQKSKSQQSPSSSSSFQPTGPGPFEDPRTSQSVTTPAAPSLATPVVHPPKPSSSSRSQRQQAQPSPTSFTPRQHHQQAHAITATDTPSAVAAAAPSTPPLGLNSITSYPKKFAVCSDNPQTTSATSSLLKSGPGTPTVSTSTTALATPYGVSPSSESGRRLRVRNQRRFLPEKVRHKRQTLQDMTRPLKQWLYRHRENPYPSKAEKMELVHISDMSLTQVSNWFANARRRLKNTVQGEEISWSNRITSYNDCAEGNAELFSIPSSEDELEAEADGDNTCSPDQETSYSGDVLDEAQAAQNRSSPTTEHSEVTLLSCRTSSTSPGETRQRRRDKPITSSRRDSQNVSAHEENDEVAYGCVEGDTQERVQGGSCFGDDSHRERAGKGRGRGTTPSPSPTLTSSLSDTGCGVTSGVTSPEAMTPACTPGPPLFSAAEGRLVTSPIVGGVGGMGSGGGGGGAFGPACHKYKHSMMQRYLQDASQQTSIGGDLDLYNARYRHRHLSSSTGSHDFEYLSTSSVSSPTHEPQEAHPDTFDDFSEEFESIAIRRRLSEQPTSGSNDDMYWKEIGAALALTTLARSNISK